MSDSKSEAFQDYLISLEKITGMSCGNVKLTEEMKRSLLAEAKAVYGAAIKDAAGIDDPRIDQMAKDIGILSSQIMAINKAIALISSQVEWDKPHQAPLCARYEFADHIANLAKQGHETT